MKHQSYVLGTCPNGFVFPDDPSDVDNWYPNRTFSNCAFRCHRFIQYTDSEWDQIEYAIYASSTLGFVLVLMTVFIQLVSTCCTKTRSYHYFIITLILLSLLQAFTDVVVRAQPVKQTWCRNNGANIDGSEGISACIVQAFVTIFCKTSMLFCCLIQALITYAMVIHGKTDYHLHKGKQLGIILGLPFIGCILYGVFRRFGSNWNGAGPCSFNNDNFVGSFIPVAAIILLSMIITAMAMIRVMFKFSLLLYRTWKAGHVVRPAPTYLGNTNTSFYSTEMVGDAAGSSVIELASVESGMKEVESVVDGSKEYSAVENKDASDSNFSSQSPYRSSDSRLPPITEETDDSKLWDIFALLKTPFIFTIFFVFLQSTSIINLGNSATYSASERYAEYNDWGNCVLQHYDGTDESWITACGAHLPTRMEMKFRMWLILTSSGQSMFVACISAPSTFGFLHQCYQNYKNRTQ